MISKYRKCNLTLHKEDEPVYVLMNGEYVELTKYQRSSLSKIKKV